MKFYIIILIFILNFTLNASDKTEDINVSVNYGESSENIDLYRVSVKNDFEYNNKFLPEYYEISVGNWDGKNSGSISSLSILPMFRYTSGKHYESNGYIEIGIGATYISETQLEDENFGVHFQFENIFGIGYIYKNFEIGYRFIHYSNAGLSSHNNGVTFDAISISYKY